MLYLIYLPYISIYNNTRIIPIYGKINIQIILHLYKIMKINYTLKDYLTECYLKSKNFTSYKNKSHDFGQA